MTNHIQHVELRDRSVVPAEAEVHVTVTPASLDAGTAVRGRLMGPRCRFATTVEVAYHLRPLLVPTGRPAITLRAIIPEASLWEPESPFLYTGPIELWQDGTRCETLEVRHGLRQVSVGPRGLRLNGRLLRLRGRRVSALDDATALQLREAGYNLLVAPVDPATTLVWDVADRIGFFVLGQLGPDAEAALPARLAWHPSCLGWLVEGPSANLPANTFVGTATTRAPLPHNFLAVSWTGEGPAALREAKGPVLLLDVPPEAAHQAAPDQPAVIGVVES